MTWVLHVDLDQFLASVELRRHPELVGLPVIVGGSGDPTEPRKVVTCASYEAREFGVHAGMPLRTAARKCPEAVFLPSDAPAYDEASEQVMGLLRDLGHPVEVWGWDEAYVGAAVADPFELAEKIRAVIAAETGLSCSVGISDNKQRAKVATGFGKPAGVFALTAENWMTVMGDRPVDALWGVGPKTAKKLAELDITTVAELARRTLDEIVEQGRVVTRVAVTLRTRTFFTRTKIRKLPAAGTDLETITRTAIDLLHDFELDRPVRLLGVRLELEMPK